MHAIWGTIASAARPLRDIGGLAAPIRSARMRARTLFFYQGFFMLRVGTPVHARFNRAELKKPHALTNPQKNFFLLPHSPSGNRNIPFGIRISNRAPMPGVPVSFIVAPVIPRISWDKKRPYPVLR